MKSARFWAVVLLMTLAAATLHLRGDVDRVPPSQPLRQLPEAIGSWTGTDIPLDDEVLQVLGHGSFLNRQYAPAKVNGAGGGSGSGPAVAAAPVGLFIGYFPTQRTGQAIHSPQNCLPGAGWVFESSGVTTLTDRNGKTYRVGDYLISDGKIADEVLYWYQSHGRSMASDYTAKLYTLADSIRYNRTDAALVRVITPVQPGESRLDARQRAVGFAEQLAPLLPAYIPD